MPWKAEIKSGIRFENNAAQVVLDLKDDAGKVIEVGLTLGVGWEEIQARMDAAAAESPPRIISPAAAITELVGEWVDRQREVIADKAPGAPPDFSGIVPGQEISEKMRP